MIEFEAMAGGRDPVGWLAAADFIEESGRPGDFTPAAEDLRRMGELGLALLPSVNTPRLKPGACSRDG